MGVEEGGDGDDGGTAKDASSKFSRSDVEKVRKTAVTSKIPAAAKLPTLVSEHRADATYCVVGAASLIAKTTRDQAMRDIEDEIGDGTKLGTGYPSDPKTLAYLEACGGEFPQFVRQSWKTVDRFR